MKQPIADSVCDMTVAAAAPATPQRKQIMKIRSIATFRTEDMRRNIIGVTESPMLLKIQQTEL